MPSLFSFVTALLATVQIAPPADIQSSLDAYARTYPRAAIIMGVVDGSNTTVYTAAGRVAQRPDERSTYQIGSITKTFTATLLATMVRAGSIKLDAPIAKYLPALVRVPSYDGKPITVLSLAEQDSGLPRLAPNFAPQDVTNPYADYTPADLYSGLERTKLTRAPGAQYEYSNFGVTLLGQLLANVGHTSYADLVRTKILVPLGMTDTVVTGTAQTRSRLVPGFEPDGTPEPPWDFETLGAAGSIESDMHDMLMYLKANMNAPQGPLGAAMAEAQRPRAPMALGGIVQIGLIWVTNVRSGITWHNGETGGYHAFIGFDRSAHHGVVLLANIADMDLDAIAVHVLAPYVPASPPK
jgi:CubicO group peptidase (beta-lactamase class C family)